MMSANQISSDVSS